MRNNRAAFDRWPIVPRMAHGVTSRDLSPSARARPARAGAARAGRRRGADRARQRPADRPRRRGGGMPYVFSNQGGNPMEETAPRWAATPRWVQLYWSTDEELVDRMIRRAEAIGAGALVVTLDTTLLGWRPQDLNLGSLPFARGSASRSTPPTRGSASSSASGSPPAPAGRGGARSRSVRSRPCSRSRGTTPARSWRTSARRAAGGGGDLPRHLLQPRPELGPPGHPARAHQAAGRAQGDPASRRRPPGVRPGVDAIVVSNHGGRQVDNAIASLDALVAVREAVGPEPTVLLDSGIRTGADVFTALALGADACCSAVRTCTASRSPAREGVAEVVANVVAELDLTMALTGVGECRRHRPRSRSETPSASRPRITPWPHRSLVRERLTHGRDR